MDHPHTAPVTGEKLSTEQAKRRLLESLDRCSPTGWLREHPWSCVGIGLFAGFVMGSGRSRRDLMATLVGGELATLVGHLLRK